jgi:hypothetical protein
MIQTYAIIDATGLVTNLVLWDGETPYDVSPNILVATNADPLAQIGGSYANGVFTPAPVAAPERTWT